MLLADNKETTIITSPQNYSVFLKFYQVTMFLSRSRQLVPWQTLVQQKKLSQDLIVRNILFDFWIEYRIGNW
jgi:hypothetical protein